jgi:hypothetical protein
MMEGEPRRALDQLSDAIAIIEQPLLALLL